MATQKINKKAFRNNRSKKNHCLNFNEYNFVFYLKQ